MPENTEQFSDPLVRQTIFPEASQVFGFGPVSLNDAWVDCRVVIDTNALLLPYSTGKGSLGQIESALKALTAKNQLRVPGQVAREFADNRSEKLKTLFSQLSRKREFSFSLSQYPLLEGLPSYAEIVDIEKQISTLLEKQRRAIGLTLEAVAAWSWNDPVSTIYRALFTPDIVVELTFEQDALIKELKYRQEHRIPPGYKDAKTPHSGIGDFLIWKTILQIGKDESKHLIFVSGDEKTDWRYQSENRSLYPRFELLDEYRRASNGRSFFIISFAELLEHFGAPSPIVEEVRAEEISAARNAATSSDNGSSSDSGDDLRITPKTLRRYLQNEYPTRKRAPAVDAYRELALELETFGIKTLSQLAEILSLTEENFAAEERARVQVKPNTHFWDVGLVRVSMQHATQAGLLPLRRSPDK